MEDSRTAERYKLQKDGKVVYNNNLSVVPCTVSDISENGARLDFIDGNFVIPNNFTLLLPDDNIKQDAVVRWRKGKSIGIDFVAKVRRVAERQKMLKAGKLTYDNGARSVDCVVRNISKTGAKIELKDTQAILPETVSLFLPQASTNREAKVVWRDGNLAGLHFIN